MFFAVPVTVIWVYLHPVLLFPMLMILSNNCIVINVHGWMLVNILFFSGIFVLIHFIHFKTFSPMNNIVQFDNLDYRDFLFPALGRVNIFNIRLIWYTENESKSDALVCTFLRYMRKYSSGYIVQEWRDCYCHVTFVSHCAADFYRYASKCIEAVSELYKLADDSFLMVD